MYECDTCGQWRHDDHVCPPAWETWAECEHYGPPFDPEEATIVYARNAEEAAEEAGEKLDAEGWMDEKNLYGPVERHFWVRPQGSKDEPQRWTVTEEMNPTYSARRAD